MNEDIAAVFGKQAGSLYAAHIVVCIDAADMTVFPFYCDDRNLQIRQFAGRKCKAHHNEPFDIIGQKLSDILPFRLFLFVSDKDKEFIAEMFIGQQNPVQHFRIIVIQQIGNNNANKFGVAVCKNPRYFVFFIIQTDQRVCNDFLIFKGERVWCVKVSGNSSL